MKILIKINIISEVENIINLINNLYSNIKNIDNCHILLNINHDIIIDDFLSNKLLQYENISIINGNNNSIVEFLNYGIFNIDWDYLCSIESCIIPEKEFDIKIIENIDEYDVLLLKSKSYMIPVIKREYYNINGLYNEIYKNKCYTEEFIDILKIKKNYKEIDINIIDYNVDIDNYQYNKRKKCSFNIINNIKLKKYSNKSLNDFVDKIYCINLKRRPDRWEKIKKEFKSNNLFVERFDAVDGMELDDNEIILNHNDLKLKNGAQGALKSHRSILKDAIDNNYERICIFEDDISFCKDFINRFKYYAKFTPDNWDIMYLGCHFNNCPLPEETKKKYIFKNIRNYGCFSMIIKKEMIKKIYEYTKDEIKPIDNYIAELCGNNNFYSFIPFFVKTINTKSDISDSNVEFEYDVVNKYYKDYVNEGISLITKPIENKKIKSNIIRQTESDILKKFMKLKTEFLIYKRGVLIFDSTRNRQNIKINNNNFEVYGKQFNYIGIQIKNKKN
jgi:GR25 family glycosyltransferase involved in LPS biosynthesis